MLSVVSLIEELLGARPMDVLTGGYHDYPNCEWLSEASY